MPPKKQKTRHSSGNCFGPSAELPDDGNLFTLRDILAYCEWLLDLTPDQSNFWIAEQVAPKIIHKWKQCNPELVLITELSLKNKIARAMTTAQNISKKKVSSKQKDIFLAKIDRLFDILCCQCPIKSCASVSCSDEECAGAHIDCSCLREFKIPVMELRYVLDQRTKLGHTGLLQMGPPDLPEAVRQQKAEARKESKMLSELKNKNEDIDIETASSEPSNDLLDIPETDHVDEDFLVGGRKYGTDQNRLNIMPFIAEVERYFVSDRAASAAALKCVGAIKVDDTKNVVHKNKIVRGRALYRASEKKKQKDKIAKTGGLKCIGVDGKRDRKTKKVVIEVINGKQVEKKKVGPEEHLTYTVEPPGDYLTHTAIPAGKGTGRDLANDFIDVLAENDSTETIQAVVADGTNVNVGWKDGFIGHVERDLHARLLWLICMLHGNELPFRHYFCYCDGGHGTSGPDSFKGPIGQSLKGEVHLKDVIQFEVIPTSLEDLDDEVWHDLSRDQKLLYQYTKAIEKGEVSDRLAGQVAGPIDHSRWLTLAIRILQQYTRTLAPTSGLKMITIFICQVYVPMWFNIKKHSKFTKGPGHLFHLMKLVKLQSEEVQGIVKPHIQRNAFFAEPGIMLTSMLEDPEEDVRQFGVSLIQKSRKKPSKPPKSKHLKGIRKHQVPLLNWNATSWKDMIDWKKIIVWEPRMLEALTLEQIESSLHTPISFPKYPCHSQTVERMVKLVTEVATSVFGEERQQGKVLTVLASRKSRKAYDTKKDYKVAWNEAD